MEKCILGIRSRTSIRSTPTRHSVDTSIACMALSIGPEDLKRDLASFITIGIMRDWSVMR